MKRRFKKQLKQTIFILLKWAGIIRLFQFLHRNQIVILMIHGVMVDKDVSLWKPLRPQLSRDKLDEYLSILSKKYKFVSLSDAVDMLSGRKPLQPNCIVLTFDDGYRNNFTHALPVIRKYNIPAIFYVSTGFVNNPKPFWWDRLDYAIQQIKTGKRNVKFGSIGIVIENSSREILEESFKKLRRAAKKLNMPDRDFREEIERLSVEFEQESGKSLIKLQQNDDWSAVASWDTICAESSDDVTIGSHTVDHVRLGLVEKQIARDQLDRSKKEIENRTGKPCLSISYPNGSLNDETVKLAIECGYCSGVTTREGFNSVGIDPMRLNRINVPTDMNTTEFLSLISGVSSMLNSVKQFLLYPVKLFGKVFRAAVDGLRLFRSHGIKVAFKRIGAELYSNTNYIILRHELNDYKEIDINHEGFCIEQLKQNDANGIKDVCAAWPENWRSRHLKTKVVSDLEKGDLCFLIRSGGKVIGATWLGECDEIVAHCPVSHYPNERVNRSIFIIPQERGKGLSLLLLNHIIKVAKEKQFHQVFAYVRPGRTASIKAHQRAGFDNLGTLKVSKIMGKTRYKFVHNIEQDLQKNSCFAC